MEKDVNFRQAVGSNYVEDFDHKYIVKASAIGGKLDNQLAYTEDPIAEGTIDADFTLEGLYEFEYNDIGSPNANFPEWNFDKTNTTIAILIWKDKLDGTKEVVNSIMVDVE